jgi:hypothetical protein
MANSPEVATNVIGVLLNAHVLDLWPLLVAKAVGMKVVDMAHVDLQHMASTIRSLIFLLIMFAPWKGIKGAWCAHTQTARLQPSTDSKQGCSAGRFSETWH